MSSPQSPEPTSREQGDPADDALRPLDLARHSGVSVETLRYYERLGLLDEPRRSPGGHRRYPPEALERMQLIKTIRRLGYGLPEVADLFAAVHLVTAGGHASSRTDALLDVNNRIAALEQIRSALTADPDHRGASSSNGRPDVPLLSLLTGDEK